MLPHAKSITRAERPVNPNDPVTRLGPDQPLIGADGRDWSWAYVWFKDVPGFPMYKVEWHGSVWTKHPSKWAKNWTGTNGWTKLNPAPDKKGYRRIILKDHAGNPFGCLLHRLVLMAFVGPCPPDMEACHYDGNSRNNAVPNLRWDTRKANNQDKARHGTPPGASLKRGSLNEQAKLTEESVREARGMIAGGKSQNQVARELGVSHTAIQLMCKGETWRHVI